LTFSLELGARWQPASTGSGGPNSDRSTEKRGEMQELRIVGSLADRRTVWNLCVDHEASRTKALPMPGMHASLLSSREACERQHRPAACRRSCVRLIRWIEDGVKIEAESSSTPPRKSHLSYPGPSVLIRGQFIRSCEARGLHRHEFRICARRPSSAAILPLASAAQAVSGRRRGCA
jgi:hypothetical protein